jgi:hypothetical protein
MQQIADWLEKLGMSEYAQRFAENGINVAALRHLTDQDLKDIGVLLGHRRVMLAAIGGLGGPTPATPEPAAQVEPKPQDTAERRQVMFSDLVGSTALSARMLLQHLNMVRRRGSCISHGRDPASAGSGRDQDFLRLAVRLGREQADPSYVAAAPRRRFSPGLARGRATPPRRRGQTRANG